MCYSNSSQKLVQDSNCRIFRQAERSSLQAWSIAGVLLVFGWNDSLLLSQTRLPFISMSIEAVPNNKNNNNMIRSYSI